MSRNVTCSVVLVGWYCTVREFKTSARAEALMIQLAVMVTRSEHELVDLGVMSSFLSFGGANDRYDGIVGGEAAEHAHAVDSWVLWVDVVDVVLGEDRMKVI